MKKLEIILAVIIIPILVVGGISIYRFYEKPNYERLNYVQEYVAQSIANTFEKKINKLPKDERVIIDYDSLMNSLNFIQRNLADRIFAINPKELGFKGPFYSKGKPNDLVKIQSVKLGKSTDSRETGVQFCPKHSYLDYQKMVNQMKIDIGKTLYIDSGYRSPGRQAYLFLHYLPGNKFSLKENAKWIAMPGYSQHGDPVNNAIDFTNADGINGFSNGQTAEDFVKLPEYAWMIQNANKYNFYLSYPKNNRWGVAFEPWHWHWEIKK